ncbi:MAG: hypothetical protein HOP28_08840 [Gemmatimonadales bacterium]|nr:hypothetical protein [Gemmatimonadales bacterium]
MGQTGLLVVAHGADAGWNTGVRDLVKQVRWDNGPVAIAFLMGSEAAADGWNQGIARLLVAGAKQIIVVPLMVSSHGSHYQQVRHYAGESAELPAAFHEHEAPAPIPVPVTVTVTAALDDAAELGEALLERWRALDERDRRRPLVLVAHGPSTDREAALWVRNIGAAAEPLSMASGHPVAVGLLRDDAPPPVRAAAIDSLRQTIERLARQSGDSVSAMPVLISRGGITQVTIPKDLAGLPVRYAPASLTPLPAIARWIERVALAKLAAVQ